MVDYAARAVNAVCRLRLYHPDGTHALLTLLGAHVRNPAANDALVRYAATFQSHNNPALTAAVLANVTDGVEGHVVEGHVGMGRSGADPRGKTKNRSYPEAGQ